MNCGNSGDFAFFELSIFKRRRAWRWAVLDQSGNIMMTGDERSRPAAQYNATRATLQLLLTAPYRRRAAERRPLRGRPINHGPAASRM